MNENLYTFFNLADNSNAHDVTLPMFNESLSYNILFQDKLVLPDIYYQQSKLLFEHLSMKDDSLFMEATKNGLIIPALRFKGKKTLQSTLNDVMDSKHEQNDASNINNEFDKNKNSQLKNLIIKIDDAVKSSKSEPINWNERTGNPDPNSSQKGLKKEVWENIYETNFNRKILSHSTEVKMYRDEIWALTKPWRSEKIFSEACDKTKFKSGDIGLRRGELFKSLSARITGEESEEGINLDYNLGFIKNPKEAEALKLFWSWINQCYHINMSKQFKSRVNLPKYNSFTDFTAQKQVLKHSSIKKGIKKLSIPVKVCSIKSITNLEPKTIIKLSQDSGNGYRYWLRQYSNNPNDYAAKTSLIKEAQIYCNEITKKCGVSGEGNIEIFTPEDILFGATAALAGLGEMTTNDENFKIYLNLIEKAAVIVPFAKKVKKYVDKKINDRPRLSEISIDFIKT